MGGLISSQAFTDIANSAMETLPSDTVLMKVMNDATVHATTAVNLAEAAPLAWRPPCAALQSGRGYKHH